MYNILRWGLLASCPTPKLENHPLSAVGNYPPYLEASVEISPRTAFEDESLLGYSE
jgi:hypothetical protein